VSIWFASPSIHQMPHFAKRESIEFGTAPGRTDVEFL
jgi:hypothetical protein